MDKEQRYRIIFGIFLFGFLFGGACLITLSLINGFYIWCLFLLFFLILFFFELYFRIQHNIDQKFKLIVDKCLGVEKGIDKKEIMNDMVRFNLDNFSGKDDVTVILAVRDRDAQSILNAFRSIRNQEYPQDLIKIKLVDYDSQRRLSKAYKKLCSEFDAEYLLIENRPFWFKSHALNIAIKKVDTKYILSTDTDIIFQNNYIAESIKILKRDPFQVILFNCLDLPKSVNTSLSFEQLRDYAKPRFRSKYITPGINLTLTYFYHKIRGYDEYYAFWGALDDDLIKRFKLLGLSVVNISGVSSYLHQWHAQSKKRKKYQSVTLRNKKYFLRNNSIIRNLYGWGEIN